MNALLPRLTFSALLDGGKGRRCVVGLALAGAASLLACGKEGDEGGAFRWAIDKILEKVGDKKDSAYQNIRNQFLLTIETKLNNIMPSAETSPEKLITPRVGFKNRSSNISDTRSTTYAESSIYGTTHGEEYDHQQQRGGTYDGQAALPRLPIPSLEETLDKFPSCVCALLDNEHNVTSKEMEKCMASIQTFLQEDGPRLQELLVEYEREGREKGTLGSYVEEFWSEAYLAPDSSVVMNLNPFFVLEVSS